MSLASGETLPSHADGLPQGLWGTGLCWAPWPGGPGDTAVLQLRDSRKTEAGGEGELHSMSEACVWAHWPGFAVGDLDHWHCGVFSGQHVVQCRLELTKAQIVVAWEECVQAIGWLKARLADIAIYIWGRWSVTTHSCMYTLQHILQHLHVASPGCLEGMCLLRVVYLLPLPGEALKFSLF